ncbi:Hypothetical protein FKW44_013654 [Caligus rogercresseyi]|uniref:Uncharacterized protein n=1 Tax=Caligus rogercresseyi TaxID=217165 RepID=A0A7T8GY45_CALRO|nr:Hypothetical protein FKW44_013654 [Caligus rogercresseyi]
MYFNKFHISSFGLHYSFEPPHGGGNTGRNLFLRQRFSRSRPPTTVRMTGFYLEKRKTSRAAEDSLQKAKATLSHGLS